MTPCKLFFIFIVLVLLFIQRGEAMESIGSRIKRIRMEHNLSQKELYYLAWVKGHQASKAYFDKQQAFKSHLLPHFGDLRV